jgi:hypothetical protein
MKEKSERMTNSELVTISPEEQKLALSMQADLDGDTDLVVPILKICQSLTAEVVEGEAKPGDFINGLTQENFGSELEFVVAAYQKGRFYSDKDTGRSYSTTDTVAPDSWPEEYAGRAFTSIDDAEERFREAVDAGTIEWGSGPAISTTHNFIGLVGESPVPVRLSLMRTSAPAARKLKTMLRFSQAFWDNVFVLKTETKRSSRNEPFQSLVVKQGGKSSPEQRQSAVQVALAVKSNGVTEPDAEVIADKPAKPKKSAGSLDI